MNLPNQGDYMLQHWIVKCIDKNNHGRVLKCIKSTKSFSSSATSGAASLGDSSMFFETSFGNSGSQIIFVSFGRTNIFHNIIFSFFI